MTDRGIGSYCSEGEKITRLEDRQSAMDHKLNQVAEDVAWIRGKLENGGRRMENGSVSIKTFIAVVAALSTAIAAVAAVVLT